MSARLRIACALFTLLPIAAGATTWGETTVDDPIERDAKCAVQEPGSYGSYIYQYPSKWDQVYWPLTEASGVWFCPASGFTAFIGDFDGITDAERTAIRAWLAQHYDATGEKTDTRKRIELLEGIYALRNKDADFRNQLLRVLAYWYDAAFKDPAAANAYRQRALQEIRTTDPATLTLQRRLSYLFVSANYERELGNAAQADAALDTLDAALKTVGDEDKKIRGFADYLRDLMDGSRKIAPGGSLAPTAEEESP